MQQLSWRQLAALRKRRQHLLAPAPRARLDDVVRTHVAMPRRRRSARSWSPAATSG
jgi:hypothetical protein